MQLVLIAQKLQEHYTKHFMVLISYFPSSNKGAPAVNTTIISQ